MNQVTALQNGTAITDFYQRSPAVWKGCPFGWIAKNKDKVVETYWDATKYGLNGTQTTQIRGPIEGTKIFASTDGGVVPVSAINSVERVGGAISFTGGTDNHSASLWAAYPGYRASGLKASAGPMWFEACWATTAITTNGQGFFVGLAEVEQYTLATGVPFNGGDAITNAGSLIGFRKGEDALGVLDTVYSDRATAFTNVTGGTTVGGSTDGNAITANTPTKFGMRFDVPGRGDYDSSRAVRFFQDNVENQTAISRSTLTGLTNADANNLGPAVSIITDSAGTAIVSYLLWLHCIQIKPGIEFGQ